MGAANDLSNVPPRYLAGFLAAVLPGHTPLPPQFTPILREEALPPVAAIEADLPREEQIKQRLHPFDAFTRLLECVRTNQPPNHEDRFRFQWFGLFYQAPVQDAFLLRLRLPGGRLKAFQLSELSTISQEQGNGCLILNPQGGLDVPGLRVQDAAEVVQRIEQIGLRSMQTGGNCVQAVRGGEYDGLGDDTWERVLLYPLVRELEQLLASSRTLADLPGPCELFFCRVGEQPPVSTGPLINPIVVQVLDGTPTTSGDAAPDAPVGLLSVAEQAGGYLLPLSNAVAACWQLLTRWAAEGSRIDPLGSRLADFVTGLQSRGIEVVPGATYTPTPRKVRGGPPTAKATVPSIRVPGARLLSRQLSRLAALAEGCPQRELRLVNGQILVPGTADPVSAARELAEALDA